MSAQATPQFALRPYLPQDAPVLADIFRASVEELTEDDYSPEQQEAWASAADDMDEFAARLGQHALEPQLDRVARPGRPRPLAHRRADRDDLPGLEPDVEGALPLADDEHTRPPGSECLGEYREAAGGRRVLEHERDAKYSSGSRVRVSPKKRSP